MNTLPDFCYQENVPTVEELVKVASKHPSFITYVWYPAWPFSDVNVEIIVNFIFGYTSLDTKITVFSVLYKYNPITGKLSIDDVKTVINDLKTLKSNHHFVTTFHLSDPKLFEAYKQVILDFSRQEPIKTLV